MLNFVCYLVTKGGLHCFSSNCCFFLLLPFSSLSTESSPLHCLWLQLFPSPHGKALLECTNTPCSFVWGLMRKVAGDRETLLDDSSKPLHSLGHFDTSSLRLLFASSCSRPPLFVGTCVLPCECTVLSKSAVSCSPGSSLCSVLCFPLHL